MNAELSEPLRAAPRIQWLPPGGQELVRAAVETGNVVVAYPRTGIPMIWRAEHGYRVRVYQYGAHTRDQLFVGFDDALAAFCAEEARL